MLSWSLVFFALALFAGILDSTGIAGTAASVAPIAFFLFLVLLLVTAIAAAIRGRPPF